MDSPQGMVSKRNELINTYAGFDAAAVRMYSSTGGKEKSFAVKQKEEKKRKHY